MNTQITTLANGMRIVTEYMGNVETATLGVWVDMGTRFETSELNGISHLFEHMAFKGTESRTAQQIVEEIEDVGGWLNAYTSREVTAYYAKVLKENVKTAIDVISDILLNSSFPQDELDKEKEVVVQEIMQNFDDPDDLVFDHFQKLAYPEHSLGMPILGSVDTVRKMTRDNLFDVMAKNYKANRMVFAVAGNVQHEKVVEMVKPYFEKLTASKEVILTTPQYQGGYFFEKRPIEQANVVVGFNGVSCMEDDYYTASVFSTAFGGGMSSRLFQEVREKRGLVYTIFSNTSAQKDCGLFSIYAGCGVEEVTELLDVVRDEILKTSKGFDIKEIKRAKAQIKASILMSLESTSSRSEQSARQLMIFKRIIEPQELVAKIEAVDNLALINFAEKVFSSKPSVAMIAPKESEKAQSFSLN
ncbi:MAG: M16 family metallopeptidase [Alphaproteobacteria bacterium]